MIGLFLLCPGWGTIARRLGVPQPSKNNNTRRRVAPFNTAIPPTNTVLTTHTHGVWLLEIVVSFSSLDTKFLPRWKFIFTIYAIRTRYGLTIHGGGARDHPRIWRPHDRSIADVCPDGRLTAAFSCYSSNPSHPFSRCYCPPPSITCPLSSNPKFYPRPAALTTSGRPVHMP